VNKIFWNPEALEALPKKVRIGTSSWNYPGWKGLVYQSEYRSEKEFRAENFREFAHCPLFRTVGIDSSFYAPLDSETLQKYHAQARPDFSWASKVWEQITIPSYPRQKRYGAKAGTLNESFLNAVEFNERVISPLQEPAIRERIGPLVFQFPYIHPDVMTPTTFLGKLDAFLSQAAKGFLYAVEVRNPQYLVSEYFEILNRHQATHCFNHWNFMPPLQTQMRKAAAAGGLSAPIYVSRILTPLGVSYEGAVKLFTPYSKLQRPNHEMRRDVVRLIRRAIERDVDAYILVNNRSEGCSPLTIAAILDLLYQPNSQVAAP
jgi:uncharacterized protein YecE (DUF72 family)